MTGIYFIPNIISNGDPDYEGISFLLEDGTFERIGEDEPYTPSLSDHAILSGWLIGLSVKYFGDLDLGIEVPGAMGFITDSSSCETAQFTAPNPFISMILDVYIGATMT